MTVELLGVVTLRGMVSSHMAGIWEDDKRLAREHTHDRAYMDPSASRALCNSDYLQKACKYSAQGAARVRCRFECAPFSLTAEKRHTHGGLGHADDVFDPTWSASEQLLDCKLGSLS